MYLLILDFFSRPYGLIKGLAFIKFLKNFGKKWPQCLDDLWIMRHPLTDNAIATCSKAMINLCVMPKKQCTDFPGVFLLISSTVISLSSLACVYKSGTCKGSFTSYVDKILAIFDHCVDILYGINGTRINVDKKWTFLDHQPTSSCKRSLWMPPTGQSHRSCPNWLNLTNNPMITYFWPKSTKLHEETINMLYRLQ